MAYLCNVNKILRHIEYIASRRDCVIIPGLGAVLASMRSSRYDAESEMLIPPSRVFSFNSELRDSDGMLTASVARAEQVSYAQASRIVKEDVEAMCAQLRAYGDVPLGKLGVLHYHSEENTVTFTPFAADRLSPATAWLCPIHTREVMAEARNKQQEAAKPVHFSPMRRAMRVAASLAVLIGLGLVLSTPMSVPDEVTYASFAPEIEQVAPETPPMQYNVPEACPLMMVKSHDTDLYIDVNPDIVTSEPALPEGAYCVVISSHATLSEAKRYIARYESRSMQVLEKDGRYRVYAATGATPAEAQRACAALSDDFPNAWVCRR